MEYLKIVLRLNHILSGVFWVGSSIILGFFITPTVADGKVFVGTQNSVAVFGLLQ